MSGESILRFTSHNTLVQAANLRKLIQFFIKKLHILCLSYHNRPLLPLLAPPNSKRASPHGNRVKSLHTHCFSLLSKRTSQVQKAFPTCPK